MKLIAPVLLAIAMAAAASAAEKNIVLIAGQEKPRPGRS